MYSRCLTKHQVLISNSSKHHIALLHQRFGHPDELNEHATMEPNEEHLLMNIPIYRTHETEQHACRHDAMNKATYYKKFGT